MKFPKIRYDSAGRLIIPRGWRVLKRNEKLRRGDAFAPNRKIELEYPFQKYVPQNWQGKFVSNKPLDSDAICYIRKII